MQDSDSPTPASQDTNRTRSSFATALGLAITLASCAGRPSFSNPTCARDYDACTNACQDHCPQEQHKGPYAERGSLDDFQVECAQCANTCGAAAQKCELALPL